MSEDIDPIILPPTVEDVEVANIILGYIEATRAGINAALDAMQTEIFQERDQLIDRRNKRNNQEKTV